MGSGWRGALVCLRLLVLQPRAAGSRPVAETVSSRNALGPSLFGARLSLMTSEAAAACSLLAALMGPGRSVVLLGGEVANLGEVKRDAGGLMARNGAATQDDALLRVFVVSGFYA